MAVDNNAKQLRNARSDALTDERDPKKLKGAEADAQESDDTMIVDRVREVEVEQDASSRLGGDVLAVAAAAATDATPTTQPSTFC
ncbi:hypothetical protein [Parasitella parasitica]|uniref:Uncharacterized protein n=1 Tax=Parasitella parasitica TaxID=35722 RepID=A0A0B7NEN0_9FUNG|nr:hypothetical protein [Parasitella parasitica]